MSKIRTRQEIDTEAILKAKKIRERIIASKEKNRDFEGILTLYKQSIDTCVFYGGLDVQKCYEQLEDAIDYCLKIQKELKEAV